MEILHQPVDLHRLAILVVFTLGSTCCATLLPNPNPKGMEGVMEACDGISERVTGITGV